MNRDGCWSTVVVNADERRALGLANSSVWILQCRLASGHPGNHATDASTMPRNDRRLWLEWNDVDSRAQSLIERNPCPVPSPQGARCVFFHGHGGPHFYATSNGRPPAPVSQPISSNGRTPSAPRQPPGLSPGPPEPPWTAASLNGHGPSTGDVPVPGRVGYHRLGEPVAGRPPADWPRSSSRETDRIDDVVATPAYAAAADPGTPDVSADGPSRHALREMAAGPDTAAPTEPGVHRDDPSVDDALQDALANVIDALEGLAAALRRR